MRASGRASGVFFWSGGGGVACRFGDFTLDPDARQLLRDGKEVHLSPKAFDLLTLLVANLSRAVPKSELLQSLWPSTFVAESNLASLAAELRRALGDSASNPRFVRTVFGFGYRFVGDVAAVSARTAADPRCTRFWLTLPDREIPLLQGLNTIGRSAEAAIPIDSPGVSRRHAQILIAAGVATLEDLGSKNGTHLNGRRIDAPVALSDGDEIALAAVTLRFRVAIETTPTETVTPETS